MGASDLNPAKHIDDVLDLTYGYNNLLQRTEGNAVTLYIWDGSFWAWGSFSGALEVIEGEWPYESPAK